MATNTGEIRDGLRYGYSNLMREGSIVLCRFTLWMTVGIPEKASLFIHSRTAHRAKRLTGWPLHRSCPKTISGSKTTSIYNQAYNPLLCLRGRITAVRSRRRDNRLAIPIRAGEKIYAPCAPMMIRPSSDPAFSRQMPGTVCRSSIRKRGAKNEERSRQAMPGALFAYFG